MCWSASGVTNGKRPILILRTLSAYMCHMKYISMMWLLKCWEESVQMSGDRSRVDGIEDSDKTVYKSVPDRMLCMARRSASSTFSGIAPTIGGGRGPSVERGLGGGGGP